MAMELIHLPGDERRASDTLLVMLPGVYNPPRQFISEGFVGALRSAGACCDVTLVDCHLGYVSDRSALSRLRDDVIGPARRDGYRRIWLLGISLGGFVALGYGARHPGDVDGIVVLSPYLGARSLSREIAAAGGPRAWLTVGAASAASAATESTDTDPIGRELWAWMAAADAGPTVYLGWGIDDRFAEAQHLMSTALPADHVSTAPGGHDWPVWRVLWQDWLQRGLLPGC